MNSFSTDLVNKSERFDYWYELVREHLLDDGASLRFVDKTNLHGEITLSDFPNIKLMRVKSPENLVTRNDVHTNQPNADFVLLLLQMSGQATLTQSGRSVTLDAGTSTLYDSTLPHQLNVSKGYDSFILRMPRHLIAHRLPKIKNLTALPLMAKHKLGSITAQLIQVLSQQDDEDPSSANGYISDAIIDSIAATVHSLYPHGQSNLPTNKSALLQRIKLYINQNLADGTLCPQSIAAINGVSERYVNKLFKSEDTSVTRWVRCQRLERCSSELSSPAHGHRSIGEIAYSWGFNNLSYFNKEFKVRYHCSPREFRSVNHIKI